MKDDNMPLAYCRRFSLHSLVLTGMLGAIGALLMVLEFPAPFVPPFVKFDLSELPVVLGGCMMGPGAGVFAAAVKVTLNFLFNGTTTMGVGELANLWGSLCYVVP
ncbi:ECF transporter S component, partial [Pyramidobacter porci]